MILRLPFLALVPSFLIGAFTPIPTQAQSREELAEAVARDEALRKQLATFTDVTDKIDPTTLKTSQFTFTAGGGTKGVIHEGLRYTGFRFTIDRKKKAASEGAAPTNLDFAWYFAYAEKPALPEGSGWYILKAELREGNPEPKFTSVNMVDLARAPALSNLAKSEKEHFAMKQVIPGEQFVDGDEYVLWFRVPEGFEPEITVHARFGFVADADAAGDTFLGLK